MSLAVVVPVHRNADTLHELRDRLAATLTAPWTLRLVVDACPEGSGAAALRLAEDDERVHVEVLPEHQGQHRAIALGLRAEPDASAWVCMDADLQDPPEAVPGLVGALASGAVFAGRRGAYESRGRRLTGGLHRRALGTITGLPGDAGAFFAMDRQVRDAVVRGVLQDGAPSVVVAAAAARAPMRSLPVTRSARAAGTSSWSSTARLRQSLTTLWWALWWALWWGLGDLRRQVTGFALVGAAGTAAYLLLFAAMRGLLPAHAANVTARVAVAMPTTWVNGRHTFRSDASLTRLAVGALLLLGVGIAITSGPLAVEQAVLGHHDRAAELLTLAVATVLATVARFALLRRWLTRTSRPAHHPHERNHLP